MIFIICMCCCCGSRQIQQSSINIFKERYLKDKHPLDIAIEKSRKENKPILLWVSFNGNATDVSLMSMLSQISSVRKFMQDSIIYCRFLVGDKIKFRKKPKFLRKFEKQPRKKFSTIGSLNNWICEEFFDNQNQFMIITNSRLEKLSDYHYNVNFDHDTTSFLNFLKKGYHEYKK